MCIGLKKIKDLYVSGRLILNERSLEKIQLYLNPDKMLELVGQAEVIPQSELVKIEKRNKRSKNSVQMRKIVEGKQLDNDEELIQFKLDPKSGKKVQRKGTIEDFDSFLELDENQMQTDPDKIEELKAKNSQRLEECIDFYSANMESDFKAQKPLEIKMERLVKENRLAYFGVKGELENTNEDRFMLQNSPIHKDLVDHKDNSEERLIFHNSQMASDYSPDKISDQVFIKPQNTKKEHNRLLSSKQANCSLTSLSRSKKRVMEPQMSSLLHQKASPNHHDIKKNRENKKKMQTIEQKQKSLKEYEQQVKKNLTKFEHEVNESQDDYAEAKYSTSNAPQSLENSAKQESQMSISDVEQELNHWQAQEIFKQTKQENKPDYQKLNSQTQRSDHSLLENKQSDGVSNKNSEESKHEHEQIFSKNRDEMNY